jgi:hypothetical protein
VTEPRQIAVVRTIDDIEQLCRQRIVELGITSLILDRYTGFTEGYWGKLLAASPHSPSGKRGSKRGFSPSSFDAALIGCCFDLVAVENTENMAKLRDWMAKKLEKRVGPKIMPADGMHRPIVIKLSRRHMKKLAKKGGEARARKLSRRKQSQIGRKAAKARWSKPRIELVADETIANSLRKLSALPAIQKNGIARGADKKERQPQPAFHSEARTVRRR